MYDGPLFDPQVRLQIEGVILVLVGLFLSPRVRTVFHLGRRGHVEDVLAWMSILITVWGLVSLARGIGFRAPFQP